MAARLIIGLIGIPLVLAVALILPHIFMTFAIMIVCGLSVYELLGAAGIAKNLPLLIAAVAFSCAVVLWADSETTPQTVLIFLMIVFITALFTIGMARPNTGFAALCGGFFAGLVPSITLSSLLMIAKLPHGNILFLVPFAVSWMCDGLAFFGGRLFGKHKLAPRLSPKKTIEGAISGLVGAIVGLTIFGIVLAAITGQNIDYPRLFLAAIACGIASQFGDLAFSYIKRQCGIKDFGSVLPGHGGLLDRFDSLIFAAPLMLFFLYEFSFLVG